MAASETIVGEALTNIPWQDRPAGCERVMWRYDANPIIPRDLIPCANSIFNSAAVPFEGAFAGVFRVDDRRRKLRLHTGRSDNGIDWRIEEEPLAFTGAEPEVAASGHYYDPRVCRLDGRYYVTWCNDHHGPTIGIAWTEGWLLIYHGVLLSCNGYVYSCGAALLDIDEPWKVRHRCSEYLLSPQTDYECVGDTPNVVFPCAALTDAPSGRITVYYGGADTVTCLAFARVDELIAFVKDRSEV